MLEQLNYTGTNTGKGRVLNESNRRLQLDKMVLARDMRWPVDLKQCCLLDGDAVGNSYEQLQTGTFRCSAQLSIGDYDDAVTGAISFTWLPH